MFSFLIGIPFLYLLKLIHFTLKINSEKIIFILILLQGFFFLILMVLYNIVNTLENIILYAIAQICVKINRELAIAIFNPIKNYFFIVPDKIEEEKELIKALLITKIDDKKNKEDSK